jgi:hypothetical protein
MHTAHLQCKGFKAQYLCDAKLYLFYFTEKKSSLYCTKPWPRFTKSFKSWERDNYVVQTR